jgi:hypothetical protein
MDVFLNPDSYFVKITIKEIYVFFVLSLLFTLVVYHLILYFGSKQRKKENLYYSAYAFFTMIHQLLSCTTHRFIFPTQEIRYAISPMVLTMSFILMMHFSILLFSTLLTFKKNIYKVFLPSYISYVIALILVSTSWITGYEWFSKHIMPEMYLIATFGTLYYIITFMLWIIKNKTYSNISALLTF